MIGAVLLCALATGSALAADQQDCRLRRYAKLPMAMDEAGLINIPMTVAGKPVKMLVDTGGANSMLTETTAAKLKLHRAVLKGIGFTSFGGRELEYYVEAPFSLGPGNVPSHSFILLPDDVVEPGDDGVISSDILAVFDVDFDFANSTLSLFLPHPCKGDAVWWTKGDYAVVPFKLDDWRHIDVTVKLDGKEVSATIDTGSSQSIMSLETARNLFGISDDQANKSNGTYPFKTLAFDGVAVTNPSIKLVSDDRSKIMGGHWLPSLIVGMGILRQLHMLVSYKENEIYVTPASAH